MNMNMRSKIFLFLLTIGILYGLQRHSFSGSLVQDNSLALIAETPENNPELMLFEDQAEILVNNLSQGRFSEIEQTLTEGIERSYSTRGGSHYSSAVLITSFYAYSSSLNPDWLNALNAWVNRYPNSSLAYTARSYFHYYYGWELRGGDYAFETPRQAMEEYREQISLSERDIRRALELDPNNPLALQHMLAIGRSTAMPRDTFEDYFQRAIAQVPFFLQAYQEKSVYLSPNWYGSEQESLNFARESVQNSPRGTAIPLVLIQGHKNLGFHYRDRSAYYRRPGVWPEIQENYQVLLEDFPDAGLYALWFSEAAQEAGHENLSRRYAAEALQREPHHPAIQARARSLGILN